MNQSIIFTDTLQVTSDNYVELTAQNMGANIPCRVSSEKLSALSGKQIQTQAEALETAEAFRFELEEDFEEKIDAEDFDDNGVVYI